MKVGTLNIINKAKLTFTTYREAYTIFKTFFFLPKLSTIYILTNKTIKYIYNI